MVMPAEYKKTPYCDGCIDKEKTCQYRRYVFQKGDEFAAHFLCVEQIERHGEEIIGKMDEEGYKLVSRDLVSSVKDSKGRYICENDLFKVSHNQQKVYMAKYENSCFVADGWELSSLESIAKFEILTTYHENPQLVAGRE